MNMLAKNCVEKKRYKPLGLFVRLRFVALVMLVYVLLMVNNRIHACAMSALIATNGNLLADFPAQGMIGDYWQYNDPWDYFSFVMANSTAYNNEDGYGSVAYSDGNPLLSNENQWYKRVYGGNDFGNVYYTGQHLAHGTYTVNWQPDVLDTALRAIRNRANRAVTVLNHARNATGNTLGNHPFQFEFHGRTYAFMHNGNANHARSFMISRVNEMNPEINWWISHPSDHFSLINPLQWVDSEVLFHYLMSYVISMDGNTTEAVLTALRDMGDYLGDSRGTYNFIMSDGERLYAFRSTPISGVNSHYKLTFRNYDDRFWAIRTSYPAIGDTELKEMELLVIDRDNGATIHKLFDTSYSSATALTRMFQIKPQTPGLKISILANPVTSPALTLHVEFCNSHLIPKASGVLHILNVKGQRVMDVSINNLSGTDIRFVDIGRLSNGVYLCRLKIGDLIATGRFTVFR